MSAIAGPDPIDPLVVSTDERGLAEAALALRAGRPIVLPTDTVYGLAVIAGDPAALDQLFELKQRPADRSIAVLVADLAQAEALATFTKAAAAAARAHWPGALTLVVDRHDHVDRSVGREDGTVGIRCPAHDFVRQLAGAVGPLATTSANLSGRPTEVHARPAAASLAGPVRVIVDGGRCDGVASTVARLDARGAATVFRQGAIELQ